MAAAKGLVGRKEVNITKRQTYNLTLTVALS